MTQMSPRDLQVTTDRYLAVRVKLESVGRDLDCLRDSLASASVGAGVQRQADVACFQVLTCGDEIRRILSMLAREEELFEGSGG